MGISREQTEHVAHLSRLHLSDAELDHLSADLAHILAYVDKLGELDTDGVEPMLHAIEGAQPMRPDESDGALPRKAALANAPDAAEGCFRVPRIIS